MSNALWSNVKVTCTLQHIAKSFQLPTVNGIMGNRTSYNSLTTFSPASTKFFEKFIDSERHLGQVGYTHCVLGPATYRIEYLRVF